MDIRHLRYFVGIADCGSLMKASERLHVAQPSLSVHINNLEVELGVKLMQRSNRGIELTPEGHDLYDRAQTLIRYYQETVATIRDRRTQPSGTVSIGIPSTSSELMAAELYRRVRDELPEVTLYMAEASTAILYEWLIDSRVDFSILFSLPETSSLEKAPLQVDEFCLVSRPDRTSPGSCIDFEELFDQTLVISCQSTTWRKILDDVAEKHGKRFYAPIETESLGAIRAIILSGEANGLLPLSCVRKDVERGTLRAQRLTNPEMRGVLALANLPSAQMTPAKRAVRDIVVDVAKQSAYNGAELFAQPTPILRVVPSKLLPAEPMPSRMVRG